jgi:hypothetical protein
MKKDLKIKGSKDIDTLLLGLYFFRQTQRRIYLEVIHKLYASFYF